MPWQLYEKIRLVDNRQIVMLLTFYLKSDIILITINKTCSSLFSVPGKTKKSDRNSCSHQLCECDREFGMCLQKYLPCPTTKVNPKWTKLFDFPIRNPLPYILFIMLKFFVSWPQSYALILDIWCLLCLLIKIVEK